MSRHTKAGGAGTRPTTANSQRSKGAGVSQKPRPLENGSASASGRSAPTEIIELSSDSDDWMDHLDSSYEDELPDVSAVLTPGKLASSSTGRKKTPSDEPGNTRKKLAFTAEISSAKTSSGPGKSEQGSSKSKNTANSGKGSSRSNAATSKTVVSPRLHSQSIKSSSGSTRRSDEGKKPSESSKRGPVTSTTARQSPSATADLSHSGRKGASSGSSEHSSRSKLSLTKRSEAAAGKAVTSSSTSSGKHSRPEKVSGKNAVEQSESPRAADEDRLGSVGKSSGPRSSSTSRPEKIRRPSETAKQPTHGQKDGASTDKGHTSSTSGTSAGSKRRIVHSSSTAAGNLTAKDPVKRNRSTASGRAVTAALGTGSLVRKSLGGKTSSVSDSSLGDGAIPSTSSSGRKDSSNVPTISGTDAESPDRSRRLAKSPCLSSHHRASVEKVPTKSRSSKEDSSRKGGQDSTVVPPKSGKRKSSASSSSSVLSERTGRRQSTDEVPKSGKLSQSSPKANSSVSIDKAGPSSVVDSCQTPVKSMKRLSLPKKRESPSGRPLQRKVGRDDSAFLSDSETDLDTRVRPQAQRKNHSPSRVSHAQEHENESLSNNRKSNTSWIPPSEKTPSTTSTTSTSKAINPSVGGGKTPTNADVTTPLNVSSIAPTQTDESNVGMDTETSSVITLSSDVETQSSMETLTLSRQSSWETESITSSVSYSSAPSSDVRLKPTTRKGKPAMSHNAPGARHQFARKSTGGVWKKRHRAPLGLMGRKKRNRLWLLLKSVELKLPRAAVETSEEDADNMETSSSEFEIAATSTSDSNDQPFLDKGDKPPQTSCTPRQVCEEPTTEDEPPTSPVNLNEDTSAVEIESSSEVDSLLPASDASFSCSKSREKWPSSEVATHGELTSKRAEVSDDFTLSAPGPPQLPLQSESEELHSTSEFVTINRKRRATASGYIANVPLPVPSPSDSDIPPPKKAKTALRPCLVSSSSSRSTSPECELSTCSRTTPFAQARSNARQVASPSSLPHTPTIISSDFSLQLDTSQSSDDESEKMNFSMGVEDVGVGSGKEGASSTTVEAEATNKGEAPVESRPTGSGLTVGMAVQAIATAAIALQGKGHDLLPTLDASSIRAVSKDAASASNPSKPNDVLMTALESRGKGFTLTSDATTTSKSIPLSHEAKQTKPCTEPFVCMESSEVAKDSQTTPLRTSSSSTLVSPSQNVAFSREVSPKTHRLPLILQRDRAHFSPTNSPVAPHSTSAVGESTEESSDVPSSLSLDQEGDAGSTSDDLSLTAMLSPLDMEYTQKLQQTIAKLGGADSTCPSASSTYRPDTVETAMVVSIPVSKLSKVVRLPPAKKKPRAHQKSSTKPSLVTETSGTYVSQGVQADNGIVIDRSVLDSLLTVKVNEALLGLKEQLRETEREVKLVTEDKAKLEVALREKVKLIQELTETGFRTASAESSVTTSGSSAAKPPTSKANSTASGATALPASDKGQQKSGRGKDKEIDVGAERVGSWLAESVKGSCSRCVPVKMNASNRQTVVAEISNNGTTVDWNVLSPDLQECFKTIYEDYMYIDKLKSESIFGERTQKLIDALVLLLSHISLPMSQVRRLSVAVTDIQGLPVFQLVSKLQELERVLRTVRSLDTRSSLPAYIKAEVVWTQQMTMEVIHGLLNLLVPSSTSMLAASSALRPTPGSSSNSGTSRANSSASSASTSVVGRSVTTLMNSSTSTAVSGSLANVAPILASPTSPPSPSSTLTEIQLLSLLQGESGMPTNSARQLYILKHVTKLFQKKIREVIITMVKKNMVVPPNLLALLAMTSRFPDPETSTTSQSSTSRSGVATSSGHSQAGAVRMAQQVKKVLTVLPKTVSMPVTTRPSVPTSRAGGHVTRSSRSHTSVSTSHAGEHVASTARSVSTKVATSQAVGGVTTSVTPRGSVTASRASDPVLSAKTSVPSSTDITLSHAEHGLRSATSEVPVSLPPERPPQAQVVGRGSANQTHPRTPVMSPTSTMSGILCTRSVTPNQFTHLSNHLRTASLTNQRPADVAVASAGSAQVHQQAQEVRSAFQMCAQYGSLPTNPLGAWPVQIPYPTNLYNPYAPLMPVIQYPGIAPGTVIASPMPLQGPQFAPIAPKVSAIVSHGPSLPLQVTTAANFRSQPTSKVGNGSKDQSFLEQSIELTKQIVSALDGASTASVTSPTSSSGVSLAGRLPVTTATPAVSVMLDQVSGSSANVSSPDVNLSAQGIQELVSNLFGQSLREDDVRTIDVYVNPAVVSRVLPTSTAPVTQAPILSSTGPSKATASVPATVTSSLSNTQGNAAKCVVSTSTPKSTVQGKVDPSLPAVITTQSISAPSVAPSTSTQAILAPLQQTLPVKPLSTSSPVTSVVESVQTQSTSSLSVSASSLLPPTLLSSAAPASSSLTSASTAISATSSVMSSSPTSVVPPSLPETASSKTSSTTAVTSNYNSVTPTSLPTSSAISKTSSVGMPVPSVSHASATLAAQLCTVAASTSPSVLQLLQDHVYASSVTVSSTPTLPAVIPIKTHQSNPSHPCTSVGGKQLQVATSQSFGLCGQASGQATTNLLEGKAVATLEGILSASQNVVSSVSSPKIVNSASGITATTPTLLSSILRSQPRTSSSLEGTLSVASSTSIVPSSLQSQATSTTAAVVPQSEPRNLVHSSATTCSSQTHASSVSTTVSSHVVPAAVAVSSSNLRNLPRMSSAAPQPSMSAAPVTTPVCNSDVASVKLPTPTSSSQQNQTAGETTSGPMPAGSPGKVKSAAVPLPSSSVSSATIAPPKSSSQQKQPTDRTNGRSTAKVTPTSSVSSITMDNPGSSSQQNQPIAETTSVSTSRVVGTCASTAISSVAPPQSMNTVSCVTTTTSSSTRQNQPTGRTTAVSTTKVPNTAASPLSSISALPATLGPSQPKQQTDKTNATAAAPTMATFIAKAASIAGTGSTRKISSATTTLSSQPNHPVHTTAPTLASHSKVATIPSSSQVTGTASAVSVPAAKVTATTAPVPSSGVSSNTSLIPPSTSQNQAKAVSSTTIVPARTQTTPFASSMASSSTENQPTVAVPLGAVPTSLSTPASSVQACTTGSSVSLPSKPTLHTPMSTATSTLHSQPMNVSISGSPVVVPSPTTIQSILPSQHGITRHPTPVCSSALIPAPFGTATASSLRSQPRLPGSGLSSTPMLTNLQVQTSNTQAVSRLPVSGFPAMTPSTNLQIQPSNKKSGGGIFAPVSIPSLPPSFDSAPPSTALRNLPRSSAFHSPGLRNAPQPVTHANQPPQGTPALSPSSLMASRVQLHLPTPKIQVMGFDKGIIIKWTFPEEQLHKQHYVDTYELFAWVSSSAVPECPPVSTWAKVGQIRPLSLPMQVTLTNFAKGQTYSFAVRAMFKGGLVSAHSQPRTLSL